jgi:hypothetical protein
MSEEPKTDAGGLDYVKIARAMEAMSAQKPATDAYSLEEFISSVLFSYDEAVGFEGVDALEVRSYLEDADLFTKLESYLVGDDPAKIVEIKGPGSE